MGSAEEQMTCGRAVGVAPLYLTAAICIACLALACSEAIFAAWYAARALSDASDRSPETSDEDAPGTEPLMLLPLPATITGCA